MRLNKILFYFSLVVSIISLTTAIILTFCFVGEVFSFISNVLLSIFAGTIILMVTTIVDYFLQRRRVLQSLMTTILKYRSMFAKLRYLESKEHIASYKEFKTFTEEERDGIKVTKEMHEEYKLNQIANIKASMENNMDAYIQIASINFEETWQIYGELYFLGRSKKKEWLYNEVFTYINDLIREVKKEAFHFELYKNGSDAYEVNYEKMRELQKKFFDYEELPIDDYGWKYDVKNKYEFVKQSRVNIMKNTKFIVIAKVEEHLVDMFTELGQFLYFNKRYDGFSSK